MATNNAVNLKSSGIASYDGAGTFSALANPLTVANGGSGVSSNTAYAVLCGGTSSTNPIQSIAGVGTSGQVLTSNGAGALPTFQTKNNGYTIFVATGAGNPADGANLFIRQNSIITNRTSSSVLTQYMIANAGTIVACYGTFVVGGTLGSGQSSTLYIRLNDTTDTAALTSIVLSSASSSYSNTGLSIAVAAGDFIEFKWICPTWSPTNPTTVSATFSAYII